MEELVVEVVMNSKDGDKASSKKFILNEKAMNHDDNSIRLEWFAIKAVHSRINSLFMHLVFSK